MLAGWSATVRYSVAAAFGGALAAVVRRLLTTLARPAPRLTLYGSANFRPMRNAWMLEEMGLPFEHDPIGSDFDLPKAKAEARKARNPLGKIPTLRDGELTVYESVAINTYLGDKYRDHPGCESLVPLPGTDARGRYETLTCCILAELDAQSLWIHRKHCSKLAPMIGGINPEAVEVARKHAVKVIDVLVGELMSASGGEYLLGARFSAVDILLVHCCDWAEQIGWGERWKEPADEPMRVLSEYLERCRARPAYARAKARP